MIIRKTLSTHNDALRPLIYPYYRESANSQESQSTIMESQSTIMESWPMLTSNIPTGVWVCVLRIDYGDYRVVGSRFTKTGISQL